MNSLSLNSALGSVIGAFIGDSLGSKIEFQNNITQQKLQMTLKMQGGGPFSVGPGQVTDDSQLAMSLLRGLLQGQGVLNMDSIATFYGQWIQSDPFDIGNTTRAALFKLAQDEYKGKAQVAIQSAIQYNKNSLSNGSVMRCTPLAVFCKDLSDSQIFKAVSLDASMTHSNVVIHQIQACYVKAIVHLINNTGDFRGAYEAAKAFSVQFGGVICNNWFSDIENGPSMPGSPNIGYVKIAFDHAFRHLKVGSDFETAVAETLRLGGDTDTNACIVGGMIGALSGFEALPVEWKRKVMEYHWSVRQQGNRRAQFLDQREVYQQVCQLFGIAPSVLVVGGEGIE